MNSFKAVQRAVEYEIKRQSELLDDGGTVKQETRLWDSDRNVTIPMRSKENAHDYRYFPDPDLFPLLLTDDQITEIASTMPELPDSRKNRFMNEYGLSIQDANLLVSEIEYANYFEEALRFHNNPKAVANWIMSELLKVVNDKNCRICDAGVTPKGLAGLIKLIEIGTINGKQAKDVFAEAVLTGKEPEMIVKDKGLTQVSDATAIKAAVQSVIDANPTEAERYRNGETKLQGFFVGLVMKTTGGKANPKLVNDIIKELLGG
jgi:aspartyl-tRNA(Asn)/glutamyl-tRNA(Gln) amidotransferase subunit B